MTNSMTDNATSDAPKFDTTKFTNDAYARHIQKPWGYELHWVPEGTPYMGKIIHINKGCRLSLQLHDIKQESWLLINGQAGVIWEDANGELIQTDLQLQKGYTIAIGQRHRLVGITDCDIVEVSTPEQGTTWRLSDDYNRPNETPEQRQIERTSS